MLPLCCVVLQGVLGGGRHSAGAGRGGADSGHVSVCAGVLLLAGARPRHTDHRDGECRARGCNAMCGHLNVEFKYNILF